MSSFGRDDPREMPAHFFQGSLRVMWTTAVPSSPDRQNCSICPRYWYVDAAFSCDRCGAEFLFSASEQRVWYEDYGFWVDSIPRHCVTCRRDLRNLSALRQDYDRHVAGTLENGDVESKRRLVDIIDQLYEYGGELPDRINENRRRLAQQIASAAKGAR